MAKSHLLRLMQLVSPALPVGAYAYSQGQEYVVDSDWVKTETELKAWIKGLLHHSLCHLDMPCLGRLYDAWSVRDIDRVIFWNNFLRANRETSELLLEDNQMGQALARLLGPLGISDEDISIIEQPSFCAMVALAGISWQIPRQELLTGYAWSWLENQIAAATKTLPLGQTQAQKMLFDLSEEIDTLVTQSLLFRDDEIGLSLPGLSMASALHERQYSRLFRS